MTLKTSITSFFSLITILIAVESIVEAAPIPTTGISKLNQPQSSLIFSQMGFELSLISDEWVFLNNPHLKQQSSSQQIDLGFKYLSDFARLSLKVENLKDKPKLETYVKKYLRDYNQYGFDVQSTKTINLNSNNSIIIDLVHKNKAIQARQLFTMKTNKIFIANCTDKTTTYNNTIEMCNHALNSFKWIN